MSTAEFSYYMVYKSRLSHAVTPDAAKVYAQAEDYCRATGKAPAEAQLFADVLMGVMRARGPRLCPESAGFAWTNV